MRLPNICGLLTASALLIGANSANALVMPTELTLILDDVTNGNTITVLDSDDGNLDGDIRFNQVVGTFNILVTTGLGDEALTPGDNRVAQNRLNVIATTSAAAKLEITLIDPNLSINTQDNPTEASAQITLIPDSGVTVTGESFISLSSDAIGSSTNTGGGASSDNTELRLAALTLADTFTLTSVISIDAIATKGGSLTASVNTDVAPVPLPAALPLFLTALLGLGFVGRHRRRQAA